MSRIGRLPIAVPAGVTVTITDDNTVICERPKGELFSEGEQGYHRYAGGQTTSPLPDRRQRRIALCARPVSFPVIQHGHWRDHRLLKSLRAGSASATVLRRRAPQLVINIGSHPVNVSKRPRGIKFESPSATQIIVHGIDKQQVGAIAADIRAICKPETFIMARALYGANAVRREGKAGKK